MAAVPMLCIYGTYNETVVLCLPLGGVGIWFFVVAPPVDRFLAPVGDYFESAAKTWRNVESKDSVLPVLDRLVSAF